MTPPATATCPRCSATASGNYCSNCGAPLAGATCSQCDSPLTPGANFCHRCGVATQVAGSAAGGAGSPAAEPRGFSAGLPWGIALVAFVALVALVVGQRFGARAQGGAGVGGGAGAVAPAAPIPSMGTRAPDISAMTPEEQAVRLHDRVMALAERGRADSVQFFAPMAIGAYQRLDSLTLDHRYDLGSIAQVAGDHEMARAQADTILARSPNHLLGLMLAIRAARAAGDTPRAQSLERRFLAIEPTERGRQLPEYRMHEREIDAALAAARGR
ncbi:MAG: zinc ribbon domain-containing protein [Gemmatimonadaceae bacterium]